MRSARERNGDRGSAAVGFALVLPILLIVLFGIIDFGRMLAAKITLTEAAREGARAAALVDEDAAADRIDTLTDNLDGPIETPQIDPCPSTPSQTEDATVTLTYRFEFITPIS